MRACLCHAHVRSWLLWAVFIVLLLLFVLLPAALLLRYL